MIAIRVDANEEIAMGHVTRCMSIACELKRMGESVLFISSSDNICEYLEGKGFEYFVLCNSYKEKNEEEIYKIKNIVDYNDINTIIVDSYQVNETYLKKLMEFTRVVYIDDMCKFYDGVDILINYTYGVTKESYKNWRNKCTKFLLGSSYIPLRKEFSYGKSKMVEKANNLFITTGGGDKYNVILEIIHNIDIKSFDKVNIVVGKFYKYDDELKKLVCNEKNVFLYKDIENIYDIMKESSIAISAGGTTLAELCTLGIPTIAFSFADNQVSGAERYAEDNMLCYAGDVRKNKGQCIEKIIQILETLKEDVIMRRRCVENCKKVFDGNGSYRIAKEILNDKK